MRATVQKIRDKVHAHNRGGELYAGLRDEIRDLCDKALAEPSEPSEIEKAAKAIGLEVLAPGQASFRLDLLVKGFTEEQAKVVATLIQREHGIAAIEIKKQEGAAPVLPAAHRSSA